MKLCLKCMKYLVKYILLSRTAKENLKGALSFNVILTEFLFLKGRFKK